MDERALTLDQTIMQTEDLLVSNMDGEKVMLSVKNGKYYNLGHVGGRIWELLASPQQIGEVIDALLEEYEIDKETCQEQAMVFLRMLLKEELIRIAHEAHT